MEFKMKIRISENMAKTLGVDEDTAFESYFENGEIVIRPLSEEELKEFSHCVECPFDRGCSPEPENEAEENAEGDIQEDDDDCPVGVDNCEECKYFCPHCGRCVLEE